MTDMDPRTLTTREREVLAALLSVDFPCVDNLRRQANEVLVVGKCSCGCPSVDFQRARGLGMTIRVNAGLPDSYDGLFLSTIKDADLGEILGGIDWVGASETSPDELPEPHLLTVEPA
ncbi:hypothetical protein [Kribbella sp. NBC_00889]|uniref:hypothetical protein n=1 Tax=Kribbella sp. NBC_00889 TaxID=2975974 RepID=UPI00386DB648|nr:hypothetical protein OG817_01180 [Kribbella sp. NBC_00889]